MAGNLDALERLLMDQYYKGVWAFLEFEEQAKKAANPLNKLVKQSATNNQKIPAEDPGEHDRIVEDALQSLLDQMPKRL